MPTAFSAGAAAFRERQRAENPPRPPPSSLRYSDRHPVVDSGYNLLKLEAAILAGRLHTRYKQPEPFRRVSCALLARALTEGGVDVLLLDLRPVEEYVACHIRSARCYPSRLLYRAVNEFDAAICAYRNREDILRCIVIYDEDERVAIAAGNLFVEKGVENIRVLTGGLREFSKRFPALVQRADDYNNWSTGPVAVPQVPQPQIARRTATAASPSRPVRPVSCAALSESRSRVSLPEHRWRV